jgi:Mn2+/Fe2+ NRAMP family transporter
VPQLSDLDDQSGKPVGIAARARDICNPTKALTASALEPLAGNAPATLFGFGFLGAPLLAAAIVPLSTSYSISETFGRKADLDESFEEARVFYISFVRW